MTANYLEIPFKRWHVQWLEDIGTAEGGNGPRMPMENAIALEKTGGRTIALNGEPLMCGGLIEQWPGRYIGWAFLNRNTAKHMLPITRIALRYLKRFKGRLEFTVRADYAQGQHWARLLGFEIETPLLRAFGPEGEDHIGYVRYN